MNSERPDPDQLLARVERDKAKAQRGHLKIRSPGNNHSAGRTAFQ